MEELEDLNHATICLDTDVLVDILRGSQQTVEKIKKLEEKFDLTTTTINIFELYFGAFKSRKVKKNVKAVDELTERLEPLKLTEFSAKISGKIVAELERKGKPIDFRDAMIAGIALENGAVVYTRNVEHFKRVEGLKLLEGQ
ncbi:MAG: type II toxin-antitoxin system VapC family toxin [Archaeoglobus sp.]|nr:type II toxin-antitoxin system VapC family toxin [Archaeoglobus sp.]